MAYVDPNNPNALTIGLDVWRKQNKPALAYQFAKRCVELYPNDPTGWANLGMIADALYRFEEAETCFQRSVNLSRNDKDKGAAFMNWACMLVNQGQWDSAEDMARRALKYRPDSPKAQANLGLACLANGNWREGWPLYDAVIGFDTSRRKVQYDKEGVWDGSPGKKVVVYGEQGLGDEISFASMVPDAAKVCKSLVFECDERLAGLFRRSFPGVAVYGTRWSNALAWKDEHKDVEASASVGALGKFFRNADTDFPGTPYLVPDPDRVAMWQGLFAKQGKPVIGIAWTGGMPWTADRYRKITLEQLLPVFKAVDAVWISLQYKDASKEIAEFRGRHPEIDLRQYAYGTLTKDYDDTAALVAALDKVVSMQTAAIHLAGALGKETLCMVNRHTPWRYWRGDTMRWYRSVRLFRQNEDYSWPVEKVAAAL